jgi:hypothetical protein
LLLQCDLGHPATIDEHGSEFALSRFEPKAMSEKAELWLWTAAWLTLMALVAGIIVSIH